MNDIKPEARDWMWLNPERNPFAASAGDRKNWRALAKAALTAFLAARGK